jgi:hypothetical protein
MGHDAVIRLDAVTKTYQAGVQGPQGSPPALADLSLDAAAGSTRSPSAWAARAAPAVALRAE